MGIEYLFIVDEDNEELFSYPPNPQEYLKKMITVSKKLCIKKCAQPYESYIHKLKKKVDSGKGLVAQKFKIYGKRDDDVLIVGMIFKEPFVQKEEMIWKNIDHIIKLINNVDD